MQLDRVLSNISSKGIATSTTTKLTPRQFNLLKICYVLLNIKDRSVQKRH